MSSARKRNNSSATSKALLQFSINFFQSLHLQITEVNLPLIGDISFDLGLRHTILKNQKQYQETFPELPSDLHKSRKIAIIGDLYRCFYVFIPILGKESVICVGPFLTEQPSITAITKMCELLAIPTQNMQFLQQFYSSLPYIHDYHIIESYLESLGSNLYLPEVYDIFYRDMSDNLKRTGLESLDYQSTVGGQDTTVYDSLEKRYQLENKGLRAIMDGNVELAEKIFLGDTFRNLASRTSNTLRNTKNFLIVANTNYRKAAERADVHPVYLDTISTKFAIRIESAASISEIKGIERDMIRQYCLLVQTHSAKGYSPLIQKAINHITVHYADELSLQTIAQQLSVNKSYLASLFKREVGMTVVDYINHKRIDRAILLFNMQSGSVQSIAESVGIPNLTYFSRIFKRYKGLTPTQYIKMLKGN